MSILTHDSDHRASGSLLHTVIHAVADGVRAVWRAYIEHRRQSAQRLLIASLSDRQLQDLGLRRDALSSRRFVERDLV